VVQAWFTGLHLVLGGVTGPRPGCCARRTARGRSAGAGRGPAVRRRRLTRPPTSRPPPSTVARWSAPTPTAVWCTGSAPPRKAWAWTPWQYATDGRLGGRWDDPDGLWHTLYVGGSRLACYLQVLAVFRPDPVLSAELDCIVEPPQDAAEHATLGSGQLPRARLEPGRLGTTTLVRLACRPRRQRVLPTCAPRSRPGTGDELALWAVFERVGQRGPHL